MPSRTLIIGACGQIGSELTLRLRTMHSPSDVIASDIKAKHQEVVDSGPFEIIDAKNYEDIKACVLKYEVDTVYLMAALLSATAEKYPEKAWRLNMASLFNVLNLAKEGLIKRVFWPSSIAVFGPNTPKQQTPQFTITEPTTVYGITKQVGERWCEYYHRVHGVDVRSVRYPGIISWKTPPGGGTTDYAVAIYHHALATNDYNCFLEAGTRLPMMYMDDAIRATVELMQAPADQLSVWSSYNIAAISFAPEDMAASIQKRRPEFEISYAPDFRQRIASSWPNSIDDSVARNDWGWEHAYDLEAITDEMLNNLSVNSISD